VRQSADADREAENERPVQTPIHRKPLPPTPFANYPSSHRPPTPPKSYPHYQPPGIGDSGDTQSERYASRGTHIRLGSSNNTSPTRRPLGGRPLPSQQARKENIPPSLQPGAQPQSLQDDASRRWSVPNRKPAPWTPRLEIPESVQQLPEQNDQATSPQTTQVSPEKADVTSITLIRRDPTSGVQWNVGSIRVESRKHGLSVLQPVEVILTAPGYSRFARDVPVTGGQEASSPTSPSSASPGSNLFFRRRVGFRPLPEQHPASLQHLRRNSGDFLIDRNNTPARKIRQVYSFTSPWQGVCAFSNGVDGRSLRCRHTLPGANPHQVDTTGDLAELRFNLPWSVLRPRDINRQTNAEAEKLPISQLIGKSHREQWRRSVQNFKPKSWHSRGHSATVSGGETRPSLAQRSETMKEEHDESRISLKLGREKAGGGFKGHSAKLGKLIIEDEGLKMCDLTVASCLGVWWQHYMEGNA
jgi:hypothetical protein